MESECWTYEEALTHDKVFNNYKQSERESYSHRKRTKATMVEDSNAITTKKETNKENTKYLAFLVVVGLVPSAIVTFPCFLAL